MSQPSKSPIVSPSLSSTHLQANLRVGALGVKDGHVCTQTSVDDGVSTGSAPAEPGKPPPVSLRLLRPAQCAELLGISTTTLWRWTKSDIGFPIAFRLGSNSVEFSEAEVVAWLSTRRASSGIPSERLR